MKARQEPEKLLDNKTREGKCRRSRKWMKQKVNRSLRHKAHINPECCPEPKYKGYEH
jgi:hypothetical protein